jgi:hypothetical protein
MAFKETMCGNLLR